MGQTYNSYGRSSQKVTVKKETTNNFGETTYEIETEDVTKPYDGAYENPGRNRQVKDRTAEIYTQGAKELSEIMDKMVKDNTERKIKEQGVFYLGQGKLTIVEVGGSGFVSLKKLGKRCDAKIEEYVSLKGLTYKLIDSEQRKGLGVFPKVSKTYLLYTPDGKIYSNEDDASSSKENAKKELMELKEYLDSGIITQEEFDKKAVSLKKILLGN